MFFRLKMKNKHYCFDLRNYAAGEDALPHPCEIKTKILLNMEDLNMEAKNVHGLLPY